MNLHDKFLFLCVILSLVSWGRALGEEREIAFFNENKIGRLYNIGTKKYLSFSTSKDAQYVEIDDKKEMAARMHIRIVRDGSAAYGLILSAEEHDTKSCSSAQEGYGSGKTKQYLGCPAMKIKTGEKGLIAMERFSPAAEFKFFFSPAVLPAFHAIRIFNGGRCLAVRETGELGIEECEYEDIVKKATQLFAWVDDGLFSKNYDPMQTLDQSKNPSTPYYIADNPNDNTVWK
ncbi:hypothetical protein NEIG_00929 [Nematocida sp. ERTm5]|nr:hypothetical protein NEIG_00929 [Nematocida sp. ERTm5]